MVNFLIPYKSKLKIFLIASDIYQKNQINFLKKFLKSRKIKFETFIFHNPNSQTNEEETIDYFTENKPYDISDFIKNIDSSYSVISLPYTAILDENGKVIESLHPFKIANNIPKFKDSSKETMKKIYQKELKKFLKKIENLVK